MTAIYFSHYVRKITQIIYPNNLMEYDITLQDVKVVRKKFEIFFNKVLQSFANTLSKEWRI